MGFRDGIHKDVKGGLRRDRAQHTNAALAAGPARRETPAANVQSSERNLQRKEFTKQQKATATVSSGVGVQQAKTEPAKRSRAGAARGCRRLGRHSNEHNSWERASSRWEQSCERQTPSWKAEDAQPREPGKERPDSNRVEKQPARSSEPELSCVPLQDFLRHDSVTPIPAPWDAWRPAERLSSSCSARKPQNQRGRTVFL
ncbi:uncharacterized protein LOC119712232 isoform X2 [Motacilla alba alba]|uniref:uncharacterized protein LOC119712232 isoform X2 n=1 Tax=Motacilla alba alba TaxID=1094192 RepID=UPI0018D57184|nr:uncharacterized protein LOC119712232 isoform X2 [Motacilla alba alba]